MSKVTKLIRFKVFLLYASSNFSFFHFFSPRPFFLHDYSLSRWHLHDLPVMIPCHYTFDTSQTDRQNLCYLIAILVSFNTQDRQTDKDYALTHLYMTASHIILTLTYFFISIKVILYTGGWAQCLFPLVFPFNERFFQTGSKPLLWDIFNTDSCKLPCLVNLFFTVPTLNPSYTVPTLNRAYLKPCLP